MSIQTSYYKYPVTDSDSWYCPIAATNMNTSPDMLTCEKNVTKHPRCNFTAQHPKQETMNPFEALLLNNDNFTYLPNRTFSRMMHLNDDVSEFVRLTDKLLSEDVRKIRRCPNCCKLDAGMQIHSNHPHKCVCKVRDKRVIGMNCGDTMDTSRRMLIPAHDGEDADELRGMEQNALSKIFGDSDDSISITVKKNFSLYMKSVACCLTVCIFLLFAVIVWSYLLNQCHSWN